MKKILVDTRIYDIDVIKSGIIDFEEYGNIDITISDNNTITLTFDSGDDSEIVSKEFMNYILSI